MNLSNPPTLDPVIEAAIERAVEGAVVRALQQQRSVISKQADAKQPDMVDMHGAKRMTGLSRSTINRYIDEGRFVRPVRMGDKRKLFPRVEVEAWVTDRKTQRAST